MNIRKIVRAGSSTYTVSLPKIWVDKNRLGKGDSIFIDESSGGVLRLYAEKQESKKEKRESEIIVDSKNISTIQREITSAYVNNCSRIILRGKSINEKASKIREMIHHFVALEVDEQTGEMISAKDLLDMGEISVGNTIRRMDMTLRSIMKDSIGNMGRGKIRESIEMRDNDVNRLYFLLSRILKSAMRDNESASKLGIDGESALEMWYLAVNIENMADSAKSVARFKISSGDAYKEILQSYETVMKAYYSGDKQLADRVASGRVALAEKISRMLKKDPELAESLNSMSTCVGNIARIVIDRWNC